MPFAPSAPSAAANAAIWFSTDAFDPAKGINGRRVAGESFLRGFFAHAAVDEFVSLAHSSLDHATFAQMAEASGVTQPLRKVFLHAPARIAPRDVVFYPAPIVPEEFWRRAPHGAAAWALCGITHTTATRAVMQLIFDMRAAPQMPWDAMVCTSNAVQQSLRTLMELAEDHLATRFPGATLPARPLLPVIPLGVDTEAFRPDPAAGAALRARLGLGPADIGLCCIARLTPDRKFDPFPLFLALEAAAPALAALGGRFHLLLCGQFADQDLPGTFAKAARRLMPSVGYHPLDGGNAAERRATLSGSDIFVFPVDNLQETFGLAPVEAMAAGLPVIVSDWDGMKDTVTPDVGVRIPTEMPRAEETTHLSQRLLGGTDSYSQYLGQMSALTRIDVAALTRAIVALGSNRDLRARMGAAGQARARALYDWRTVIPQMQALWGEQSAMLAHARTRAGRLVAPVNPAGLPVGPAPGVMFASYPSHPAPDRMTRRLRATDIGMRPDVAETFALRRYAASRRLIEDPVRLQRILAAFAATGTRGATIPDVAARIDLPPGTIARAALWLSKYHFLEDCP
ncbi:glycosyltransferase family 4 protein [Tabrizicola sp.]|uniref:glycosyltransferase family 4 protein n=1 Tax=Tabrizicola sp. TaxID=2005166 RepID=UPI002639639F|nr:glycosyltransferase family 4 protein [Tabrizicola sp.]MDM7930735.1 glycosyltransferase family 4 protein [Tabrizicola sp.]